MEEHEQQGRAVGFSPASQQEPARGSQISRAQLEGEWESSHAPSGEGSGGTRQNETYDSVTEEAPAADTSNTDSSDRGEQTRKSKEAEALAEEFRQAEEEAAASKRAKVREKGAPSPNDSRNTGTSKAKWSDKVSGGMQGVLAMPFVAGMGILKAFAQAIRRLSDRLMGTSWESRARAAKENLAETREQNNAMYASHEKLMKEDQEHMAKMAYEGEELLSSIKKSKDGLKAQHEEASAEADRNGKDTHDKRSTDAPARGPGEAGEAVDGQNGSQASKDRISGYLGGFSGAESDASSREHSDAQQKFARKFDRHMRTPFPLGGLIFAKDRDFWDEGRWQTEEVGIKSTIEQFNDPSSGTRGQLADVLSRGDHEEVSAALFELASYQNSVGKDEPSGTAAHKFAAAWYLARELAESLPPEMMQMMGQEVAENNLGPTSTFVKVFEGYADKLEAVQDLIQSSPELAELGAAWHDQSKAFSMNGPMNETAYEEPVNSARTTDYDPSSVAPDHQAPTNQDADEQWSHPEQESAPASSNRANEGRDSPVPNNSDPSNESDDVSRGLGWDQGAAPTP